MITKDELELVTLEEAAKIVGKTPHNIRDYIQRGRISKYNHEGEKITRAYNGQLRVSLKELLVFLSLIAQGLEKHHRAGLHPELGFYNVPEHKRTKHVHRLHPYLGKFIPQLVEWFLSRFFKEDDVILDPFMGSGTTLVQANEMKMHSVGIDISPFNCLIAKVKIANYDISRLRSEVFDIEHQVSEFSKHLSCGVNNSNLFSDIGIEIKELMEECESEYLKTWLAPKALLEALYYRKLISNYHYQDLLKIILSRAVRSSRLVPHYDLATPKAPLKVGQIYWCKKHNRYCSPIDNCITKIHAYSGDTVRRISEYARLRSNKSAIVIQGDSRDVDLANELSSSPIAGRKIDGIFTSPPYVGQIDYHDQHIYAYELFGFSKKEELEIGPKKKGKSQQAQSDYVRGIVSVFKNVLQYLKPDAKIFVVANDRYKLYPEIAKLSGMKIIDEYHRAVTKRTEQGDDPYQETIFFLKKDIYE